MEVTVSGKTETILCFPALTVSVFSLFLVLYPPIATVSVLPGTSPNSSSFTSHNSSLLPSELKSINLTHTVHEHKNKEKISHNALNCISLHI